MLNPRNTFVLRQGNSSPPPKEQQKNDCLISTFNRILQFTLELEGGKPVEEGSNNLGGKKVPRSSGSVPRIRARNSTGIRLPPCPTINQQNLQRALNPTRTMSSDAHLSCLEPSPTPGGASPPNMCASQPTSIASRPRNSDRQTGTDAPVPAA